MQISVPGSSNDAKKESGLSLNRFLRHPVEEAFKIVNTNVLEAEQRKQLRAIRAHLDSLEDGGSQVIDV